MRFNTVVPAAALVASATAKTVSVDVGKGGFVFSPSVIKADKGDTIEFHFTNVPHSVAAGDKSNACNPVSSGGFYSGVISGTSTTFQITVDSTDPQYIYCDVPGHCQAGMVGVINGDDSGLSDYKAAAAKASSEKGPGKVSGGSVVSGGATSSTSSAADSSSSASSGSASATPSGSNSSTSGASKTSSSAASNTSGASKTTTTAPASGGASSSAAPSSTTSSKNAGMAVMGSFAGVLAAAGGVAAVVL